jgi:hypothetical protein
MQLKALKQMKYGTRRLEAGDVFDAKDRDARVLLATKKVAKVRAAAELAPPPPALAQAIQQSFPGTAPAPDPDLAAARAEYRAALGRAPWHRWTAAELRERIAEARRA